MHTATIHSCSYVNFQKKIDRFEKDLYWIENLLMHPDFIGFCSRKLANRMTSFNSWQIRRILLPCSRNFLLGVKMPYCQHHQKKLLPTVVYHSSRTQENEANIRNRSSELRLPIYWEWKTREWEVQKFHFSPKENWHILSCDFSKCVGWKCSTTVEDIVHLDFFRCKIDFVDVAMIS